MHEKQKPYLKELKRTDKNTDFKVINGFPIIVKGITENVKSIKITNNKVIVEDKDGRNFIYWNLYSRARINRIWKKKSRVKDIGRMLEQNDIEFFMKKTKFKNNNYVFQCVLVSPPRLPKYLKILDNFEKTILANKERGELTKYLSPYAILSLTMGEIISKDIKSMEIKDMEIAFNVWYAMSVYPWNVLLSYDNVSSIGPFQITKESYESLRKEHPKVLKEEFYECISFECQARAAILLNYSEMRAVENLIIDRVKSYFKNATEEEKEKFFIIVLSSLHHLGRGNFLQLFNDFMGTFENPEAFKLSPLAAVTIHGKKSLHELNEEFIKYLDKNTTTSAGSYANSNFSLYKMIKKTFEKG